MAPASDCCWPFGLHHILVALIRFTEAGGTLDVCGHSVSGALTIFQAQLSCPTTHGFAESATRFLSQGKMPAFLGGPAGSRAGDVPLRPSGKPT
ncbi:PTS system protein [Klebsiella pneumoniae]|uniref:PTS system protein n=1 Tax=Klebsiella pneumoniae TaxID=573 RepID=A0A377XWD1_KLEPN|nr:PTS system protein [Klebsiella pneumoniae]